MYWNIPYYHHHKHPGLGHLARSVSRVTVVLSIVSLVSQLSSFLVGCKGMILKGFGFVAFFVDVKGSIINGHIAGGTPSIRLLQRLMKIAEISAHFEIT